MRETIYLAANFHIYKLFKAVFHFVYIFFAYYIELNNLKKIVNMKLAEKWAFLAKKNFITDLSDMDLEYFVVKIIGVKNVSIISNRRLSLGQIILNVIIDTYWLICIGINLADNEDVCDCNWWCNKYPLTDQSVNQCQYTVNRQLHL